MKILIWSALGVWLALNIYLLFGGLDHKENLWHR
jgi:hypothetical protein